MNTSAGRTAVIGGGYAGIAAAVALTRAGHAPHVFEAGKVPGGRARRIEYRDTALDNGQHILLGAYRELFSLLDEVGVPRSALARFGLRLEIKGGRDRDFALRAPRLPAPLHLAWALATARGISWSGRLAALRLARAMQALDFRAEPGQTVGALLAAYCQPMETVHNLWEPLCIAALNTPLVTADAQVFMNVLRDALFRSRADSDLVLPRTDLSALFPDPAAAWLLQRGATIALGQRVDAVDYDGARGVWRLSSGGSQFDFDAVICAVGPHQLDALRSDSGELTAVLHSLRHFSYEPIFTVYLKYAAPLVLPFPMQGRRGAVAQWFFDRGALCGTPGLAAAVISSSGVHETMDHDEIAAAVHRELQLHTGALPSPEWHKVIAEKFATFACVPALARPAARTALPGFCLAGDYTQGDYPSTLEGAVRSGAEAARLTAEFLASKNSA